jgi:hypothetical protein
MRRDSERFALELVMATIPSVETAARGAGHS